MYNKYLSSFKPIKNEEIMHGVTLFIEMEESKLSLLYYNLRLLNNQLCESTNRKYRDMNHCDDYLSLWNGFSREEPHTSCRSDSLPTFLGHFYEPWNIFSTRNTHCRDDDSRSNESSKWPEFEPMGNLRRWCKNVVVPLLRNYCERPSPMEWWDGPTSSKTCNDLFKIII